MDIRQLDKPEPGVWYHSGRHLPPIGVKVILCLPDRTWFEFDVEESDSVEGGNAWKVPALPIDLFFKVGGVDYQRVRRSRFPMDMVFPRFKGLLLREIIDLVLAESETLTTKELTRKIYQTINDEEFRSARNSLSAELRRGVCLVNPTWRRIGKGAYAAVEYKEESILIGRHNTRTAAESQEMLKGPIGQLLGVDHLFEQEERS